MESVIAALGSVLAAVAVDLLKVFLSRQDKKAEEMRYEEAPAADNPDMRSRVLKRLHERRTARDIQP
ncbi:MAG: hypothetical protein JXR25_16185 [Pontiellaceae bacterium]|nr:hypothetical protein [Pontiellaceae bacterium]MBN2786360.1 hypothetical protein [Pontiellaceae bacterium]